MSTILLSINLFNSFQKVVTMKRLNIFPVLLLFLFSLSVQAGPMITPAPPELDAKSYLLVDYNSGRILASHNVDEKLSPASLTKIMTTYVAASELAEGHISMDDKVVVSEKAWKMPGSRMFIEVNTKVAVHDLLNGIIIQSGNDASVALAEYISGDESVFAQLMNQHAKRLGMVNTHFENASGLPHKDHYTTAHDLSILAAALIRHYPEVYKIHSHKEFTYNGIKQHNRNRLLWLDDSVDGIKTGHTDDAGYCLVTSAIRDGMRLISVVMGTASDKARTTANQALLNYGFRFYETQRLYSATDIVTTKDVWKGKQDKIALGVKDDLFVTVPRGEYDNLDTRFELPEHIIAPVEKGMELGKFRIMLDGKEITAGPLYARQAVPAGGILKRWKDEVRLLIE